MNTDRDLECTCDIGPFATCPVCEASKVEYASRKMRRVPPTRAEKAQDALRGELSVSSLALHYSKLK